MRIQSALLLAGTAIAAGCTAPTHVDIVSKQDTLKYLVSKETPDQWTAFQFDDSAWPKAPADVIAPLAPDGDGVMPAVLVRADFNLGPQSSVYKSLTLTLDVPGGFTAWVNGAPMTNAADGKSAELDLPAGLLNDSNNLLAIELHPPATSTSVKVAPTMDGKLDAAANALPHIVRGPYLLGPRPDGITIGWETSAPMASRAIVDDKTIDGGQGTHHSAVVTGLNPSSSYSYHVESGPVSADGGAPDKSEDSELVTAPAGGGERIRFVVYGDNRTDGDAHRLVSQGIDSEGPDFVVNTGDLVDSSSAGEWQTFFDIEYELIRHVPIYPALGNHEANSGGGSRFAELFPLGDKFAYAGKVYGADFGDVHLAVLDSNGDLGSQAGWLEKDLTAAEQRGAKHEFVIMHWGAYSGGKTLLHGNNNEAREYIVPVAQKHHVDALFAGHDHFYERGAEGELHYFVSGGGGAPLGECGKVAQTQVARSTHHYLVVDVQGSTVSYTAKDSNGAIIDQLAVTR